MDIKKKNHSFRPNQKSSFRGALTNWKLTGTSSECQEDFLSLIYMIETRISCMEL